MGHTFQPTARDISIGLDLGQKTDYTAVCVVEADSRPTGKKVKEWARVPITEELEAAYVAERETVHLCRELGRLALGTPYPAVAKLMVKLVKEHVQRYAAAALGDALADPDQRFVDRKAIAAEAAAHVRLTLDATGAGLPVADMLAEALFDTGVFVQPVTFTYGGRKVVTADGTSVGKLWLVSRLQSLIQTRRIVLPRTREARDMAEELAAYELKTRAEDGADQYGAFAVGAHDDMVTALGLATLDDPMDRVVQLGPDIWEAPEEFYD